MSNITFDKDAKTKHKKEDIEWLRIWCEEVNDETVPHVALIGDSITEGYYGFVKEALKGVARVDYLATSYSIASDTYKEIVKSFVKDSDYEVIHYNYGLHSYAVDEATYYACYKELVDYVASHATTILATTTTVLDETLERENVDWKPKVIARNKKMLAIAKEKGLPIDDLNAVCKDFEQSARNADGVHFNEEGYQKLADSVVQSIRKYLEKH